MTATTVNSCDVYGLCRRQVKVLVRRNDAGLPMRDDGHTGKLGTVTWADDLIAVVNLAAGPVVFEHDRIMLVREKGKHEKAF